MNTGDLQRDSEPQGIASGSKNDASRERARFSALASNALGPEAAALENAKTAQEYAKAFFQLINDGNVSDQVKTQICERIIANDPWAMRFNRNDEKEKAAMIEVSDAVLSLYGEERFQSLIDSPDTPTELLLQIAGKSPIPAMRNSAYTRLATMPSTYGEILRLLENEESATAVSTLAYSYIPELDSKIVDKANEIASRY